MIFFEGEPLKLPSRLAYWTAEEEGVLDREYGVTSNAEIALRLGRTDRAVEAKAERMGISAVVNRYCKQDVFDIPYQEHRRTA